MYIGHLLGMMDLLRLIVVQPLIVSGALNCAAHWALHNAIAQKLTDTTAFVHVSMQTSCNSCTTTISRDHSVSEKG